MTEVILETNRLLLRWFRETDFPEYAAICADPEVMKFLTGNLMNEMEAWRHMASVMGHWYFRGFGVWAVEEKPSQRLIGRIGFMHPVAWPGFELGWTLGRPSCGKGYAIEGARRALEYAFNEMDRDHVISCIALDNVRSIRVAEKLGEEVEGKTELLGKEGLSYRIHRA